MSIVDKMAEAYAPHWFADDADNHWADNLPAERRAEVNRRMEAAWEVVKAEMLGEVVLNELHHELARTSVRGDKVANALTATIQKMEE